jgi:hypothetical protein
MFTGQQALQEYVIALRLSHLQEAIHYCEAPGGTVVKVLRYKSEGRRFDSR